MGALPFYCDVPKSEEIDTPLKALREAQVEARYWHGHAGYTGTVAENPPGEFEMRNDGDPMAQELVEVWATRDGEENAKWEPAYCVAMCKSLEDMTIVGWAFYGWASS